MEACTVFLGDIAAQRNPSGGNPTGQQLLEEIFTCVHEVGHVFNLEHINDSQNFISQSPAGTKSLPEGAPTVRARPRAAAQQGPAAPGHLARRLGVWQRRPEPHDRAPATRPVATDLRSTLRIEISRNECFHFEPVELDLQIELPPEARSRRSIPNEVDPGYERLRVWIEAPEGARRELRPFASYCRAHSRYRLSHDRPFRRDSTYRDAAGHVLRTAGVHSIVAELWLASNAVLRSNTVEINIRPLAGLSDAGRHKRRCSSRRRFST